MLEKGGSRNGKKRILQDLPEHHWKKVEIAAKAEGGDENWMWIRSPRMSEEELACEGSCCYCGVEMRSKGEKVAFEKISQNIREELSC